MDCRQTLTDYFRRGIAAASPRHTMPALLPTRPPAGRTIVLGCGKAAAEMALVASECLTGPVSGAVVTRQGHNVDRPPANIEIIEARHPVPDGQGLAAAARILALAAKAGPDDRVVFLISGGGSALLCAPADGIAFTEKQAINDALVRSGAAISDINLVRRHLSRVKSGRLAATAGAHGAELLTLVISDVAGDDPALVASGPSIGAPFEPEKALALLAAAGWDASPQLAAAIHANRPPPVPVHPVHVLATNADALRAVAAAARADGWNVVDLGAELTGEAAATGRSHADIAEHYRRQPGRHLLLSGGELTVNRASRNGCGGPNLEYLTGLLTRIDPAAPIAALAGDSDGIDGTEDNAGGYFAAEWIDAAIVAAGHDALASNRCYDLFDRIGGLVVTGPTRTNVNDIRMIAVEGY